MGYYIAMVTVAVLILIALFRDNRIPVQFLKKEKPIRYRNYATDDADYWARH